MADWKTPYQEYMFFVQKTRKYEPDTIPTWVKPLPDCHITYFSQCQDSGALSASEAPSHNWCEVFGPGFDIRNHRCDRRDSNRVREEIFQQEKDKFFSAITNLTYGRPCIMKCGVQDFTVKMFPRNSFNPVGKISPFFDYPQPKPKCKDFNVPVL